jgi:hypothetical protein
VNLVSRSTCVFSFPLADSFDMHQRCLYKRPESHLLRKALCPTRLWNHLTCSPNKSNPLLT